MKTIALLTLLPMIYIAITMTRYEVKHSFPEREPMITIED